MKKIFSSMGLVALFVIALFLKSAIVTAQSVIIPKNPEQLLPLFNNKAISNFSAVVEGTVQDAAALQISLPGYNAEKQAFNILVFGYSISINKWSIGRTELFGKGNFSALYLSGGTITVSYVISKDYDSPIEVKLEFSDVSYQQTPQLINPTTNKLKDSDIIREPTSNNKIKIIDPDIKLPNSDIIRESTINKKIKIIDPDLIDLPDSDIIRDPSTTEPTDKESSSNLKMPGIKRTNLEYNEDKVVFQPIKIKRSSSESKLKDVNIKTSRKEKSKLKDVNIKTSRKERSKLKDVKIKTSN